MKGFRRWAIFPPKIASLRFQTSQHKGQKIHVSSRTFQSKIHPNGPELALEENQNPTVFERLECVARSLRAMLRSLKAERCDFGGKIAPALEPFQNKVSTLVLLLYRRVNGELKFIQNRSKKLLLRQKDNCTPQVR